MLSASHISRSTGLGFESLLTMHAKPSRQPSFESEPCNGDRPRVVIATERKPDLMRLMSDTASRSVPAPLTLCRTRVCARLPQFEEGLGDYPCES